MKDLDISKISSILYPYFIFYIQSERWGTSIWITQREGKAFGRVYWYNDDNTIIYLDNLSVNKKERKQGIGTLLQVLREEIGRILKIPFSHLLVLRDSWMHDWYCRRGYSDYKEHDTDKDWVWMSKQIYIEVETK